MFFLFGLVLLFIPDFVLDILNLPSMEGYFWNIMAFTFLLLMAVLSWEASKDQNLVKFIIFIKFASAGIYITYGLVLLTFGLIIAGCVDLFLGIFVIIGKKL